MGDVSAAPGAAGRRRRLRAIGLVVAGVLTGLDQATKILVESVLVPGEFVPLLGSHVGWQLVYNPGAAFGIPAPPWLFLTVTVAVVVVVWRTLPRVSGPLPATALGMLLAGALGNVIDRLFRPGPPGGWPFGDGYVVDFVAWGSFPRFNVADSAITIGFVLLVLAMWRDERASLRGDAAGGHPPPDEPGPDGA
jgi:signal peptidase II